MRNIKPGDNITAVYRSNANRHVIPMRVMKVGRKYIYGITLYLDVDGQLKRGHQIEVNHEKSTIYPGLRHDLRAAEFGYRDDYRKWQHKKQGKRRDFNYELRTLVNSRLGEWEQEHPMPEPPEFPAPEAEGG